MPERETILAEIRATREDNGELDRTVHAAKLEYVSLTREKQRLVAAGDRHRLQTVEAKLLATGGALSDYAKLQKDARGRMAGLVADLHDLLTPELLTSWWLADKPILLLPLRVETRFRKTELLVRVFPDEISIDTHEELLTQAEAAAGQDYWRTIATDVSETSRRQAWRKLVEAFEAPRSAYVVKRTKPLNWADLATIGVACLTFPDQPVLKEDGWTQPPIVKVFPDRLVLTLSRGGKVIHRPVGKLIPDIVKAGPSPLTTDGQASWKRDSDGRMTFDEDSVWLRDFTVAEDMGLGFRVALKPGDEAGFDELIVLGLKHSADTGEADAMLSELLAGHRYSTKGLAFVPQGAATNNTSAEDAGLDSVDWFAEASFAAVDAEQPAAAPDLALATDGLRLATYLGLDPQLFSGVPHASGRDHAEALAMNVALYPGTLGYFIRTMIGEVASDRTLDDLRKLFTRHVTGRGPLASIRVGNQPYGFVLAGPAPSLRPAVVRESPLDSALEQIIAKARPVWVAQLPQLARLGATANGSADFLAVLGLQPTSADYFQRIATTYDHLSNLAAFQSGDRMSDVFESVFAGLAADRTLIDLGYQVQRPGGSYKPYPLLFQLIYQRHQTRIPATSLIDGQPFSESETIKPYDAAKTRNYIDWLRANARDADALRAQDFGGAKKPNALLYILLRHSLLIQAGTSVNLWLKLFEIEAPELVVSRKFVGMTPAIDIAAWEILSTPANAVQGTVQSPLPLLAVVQLPEYRIGSNASIGAPLGNMMDAYDILRGLPTARLERLLAEHVDTLSYRLDAWETALIDRRLLRRRQHPVASRGLYLGALGYLENLRAAPDRRRPIKEQALHESLREGRDDLYAPTDGAGFVQTPSLNHATAAAILRNGYLTHATPADPGRLAVNLTSRRVRRAKELMDGVRNGQPIEVLLGIEFERAMHDATTRPLNQVVLNQFKPAFRAAFPIRRTKIPKAGHPDSAPTIVPDFSVANGLAIIATSAAFPVGVPDMPNFTPGEAAELNAIRNQLKDSLDSLKDVVTTETAYQLALGNFDRSAAVVQSLSAAVAPPEVEVIQSSRGTDLSFTQRATIEFDPSIVSNPWAPIPLTPRALLEPALNNWVGTLLGDPTRSACNVTLRERDPDTETVTNVTNATVRLSDLMLQPIDVMYVARGIRDASGPQELSARIAELALAAAGVPRTATVEISFATTGAIDPSLSPMSEALALSDLAHQVFTSARPVDGRDYLTSSRPLPDGTEPSGINLTDLRSRFVTLKNRLAALVANLNDAVDDAKADGAGPAEFAALRTLLRGAADAGVPFAFPGGGDGTLVGQGGTVAAAMATVLETATELETESNAPALTVTQMSEKLVAAVHEMLGADFRMMPRFTAPNAGDIAASDASRDAMLAHARSGDPTVDPVAEVLTSVAQVRQPVQRLNHLRIVAELMTGSRAELAAIQLPPRANDAWLGASLPPGHEILNDTLSIIQLRPQGFSPASPRCGLLIDEWSESFPRKSEVTGLAFGFDQPNGAPMQSLLLAVAGENDRNWSWDGLMHVVRDTMLRAKLRAVEPDMLDKVPGVTTLVPATMAEFSTSPGALSLDFGLSVPLILAQVLETPYLADFAAAGTSP